LTSKLLTRFKQHIKELTLVPAGGGCFEIRFDEDLVYSKLKTKEFPNEEEIARLLEARLRL
jgi:selenoprotein W-related protein